MSHLSSYEKKSAARKTRMLTVVDMGSAKTACLIARLVPLAKSLHLPWRSHKIEVLGFSVRRAQGMRAGEVVNIAAAELAARAVLEAAERQAGVVVKSVLATFSGRQILSERLSAELAPAGALVARSDMRAVIAAACAKRRDARRPVLHALPLSFRLDEMRDLSDPRNMAGRRLAVDMHCLSADAAAAKNLERSLNQAYLKVEAMVAAPYAAALSVFLREDAESGAICVDCGGGTTSFAVFDKGKFVCAESFGIGGQHITSDIAQGFSIPLEAAERLKVLHGGAADYECGAEQYISLPMQSGAAERFSRKKLGKIIRARAEEISEMLRDRAAHCGFRIAPGRRLVLAGGAARLSGFGEIIRSVAQVRPRMGRPLGVSGLPAEASCGAYAALAGLAVYPQALGFAEQEFNPLGTEYEPGNRLKNAGARLLKSVNGYWTRK